MRCAVVLILAATLSGCWLLKPKPKCVPQTCASAGAGCGTIPDGCGGTLDCGPCKAPLTCGGGGQPNVCGCTPTTCAQVGAGCGTISDGCGGTLDCGVCKLPLTCGGGGQPNVCGCTPTPCAAADAGCGTVSDGCLGTLDCGSCTAPNTCGGGGQANVCGCTPTPCAAADAGCGPLPDGCGNTLDCGPCGPQCGNGALETGEQCDDGNLVSGDGCDASCQIEASCPPAPAPPTTGLAAGTATGGVTLNVPSLRTITWATAAFVPVPGTTRFQIIVSDDPQLCNTLVNANQYQTVRCPGLDCSLCPGCFGPSTGYAYLDAEFDQSSPAGSAAGLLPYFDQYINVVGWGYRLAVDGAITPSSVELTGEIEICNAKYGATGSGRFDATLCAGGRPIYN